MVDSLSISLSGLTAQQSRLAGSASNIANLRTEGPLPTRGSGASGAGAAEASGGAQVYRAVDVSQTSVTGPDGQGLGTRAVFKPSNPGFVAQFSPDSPFANQDGLVASPNVNIEGEVSRQIQGSAAYRASIAALKVQDEITREALNLSS